jgi:hypothetical protein
MNDTYYDAAIGTVQPKTCCGKSRDALPVPAENIVILTDGACSSACSKFVGLMTRMGGVKTVAVGGRPEGGPMQAMYVFPEYSYRLLYFEFEFNHSL